MAQKLLQDRWRSACQHLASKYPEASQVVGYGSGVVFQTGYDYQQGNLPLLDVIFVVDDAYEWHSKNSERNRAHYRGLSRLIGPSYLDFVMRNNFPIVFFPDVEIAPGVQGKYGVVERQVFEADLREWSLMSVAGRLQKPVQFGREVGPDDQRLMEDNYRMAFSVADAILKFDNCAALEQPNERDAKLNGFLKTIVELSYAGDLRTRVGAEASDKIQKIVKGNREGLLKIYSPFLCEQEEGTFISKFPKTLSNLKTKSEIVAAISRANSKSSQKMALNQLLTDSPIRNAKYLWSKLRKGILK